MDSLLGVATMFPGLEGKIFASMIMINQSCTFVAERRGRDKAPIRAHLSLMATPENVAVDPSTAHRPSTVRQHSKT